VCGESSNVDAETVDGWKQGQVLELLKGYTPREIFNVARQAYFMMFFQTKLCASEGKTVMGENRVN
jgi:hypothetical protein